MTEPSLLNIADFAHLVGRSERTIRRYVESGKLEVVDTISGMRIPRTELVKFELETGSVGRPAGSIPTEPDTARDTAGQDLAVTSDAGQVPVKLYELALETLRKAVDQNAALREQPSSTAPPPPMTPPEAATAPEQSGQVPLQAHLAALELAERQLERMQSQCADERRRAEQAERARMALEFQLHQYQSALSEQAESLVEAQALRRTAEIRLQELERQPEPEPEAVLPLDHLKVASPRRSWGQRLRRMFRLSKAE